MYQSLKLILILVLFLGMSTHVLATHNRAGEITYEQIDDLTIRATITTYTRTSSFAADRDSLELFWGDGTSTVIQRSNNQGDELPNDIKVNFYIAEHTYPTRGTYTMHMMDPNRIAGILNIDFPNSVNIPFYIQTTFTLLDVRFQGRNNSAVLLQPPIDFACVDEIFTHNPNAYDPDGDSLSYELITPFQDVDMEVPNYILPDGVAPGPENMISINPTTGDFIWNSPKLVGDFNITFRINEYREGQLVNSIIRDMQILVRSCLNENSAPTLETIEEICVVAGELIEFDIIANDVDTGQSLIITALGGPFEVANSKAELLKTVIRGPSPQMATFRWQTDCSHIQEEFYQVVFKVEDDYFEFEAGLTALKSVRIKVSGPPPQDLTAEKIEGAIKLSWEKPYQCQDDILFQGFSVWRKAGSETVVADACRPGLENSGYEKIIFLTEEMEDGRYVAIDPEVSSSEIYCYRVLGEFAKLTETGNPFNIVSSIRSEEVCIRFERTNPLITEVSIEQTDALNGSARVSWLKPDADDVDTIFNPGPYAYQLFRANGIRSQDFSAVADGFFTSESFNGLRDSTFLDNQLNTSDDGLNYRVDFYVAGNFTNPITQSKTASSVLLTSSPNDGIINLSWDHEVPWNNFSYVILMKNEQGMFDSIGQTDERFFTVNNLVNGEESCFKVESYGRYGLLDVNEPLRNFSQESCDSPSDFEPPCPAMITVSNLCNSNFISTTDPLINTVRWTFLEGCPLSSDLASYNIYFSPTSDQQFELLANIERTQSLFEHFLESSLSGCYYLTTVDSSGNESDRSNIVCVDNCPSYELANAFTPNLDQSNDVFVPRVNRFIDRIDMEIYNRWGQLVFETNDPMINWNGTNMGGKDLENGTYYYTCRVFENRVEGVREQDRVLRGFIQLIR